MAVLGVVAVLAAALAGAVWWSWVLRRALYRGRVAARLGLAVVLRDVEVLEGDLARVAGRELVVEEAVQVIDAALAAVYGDGNEQREGGGGDV